MNKKYMIMIYDFVSFLVSFKKIDRKHKIIYDVEVLEEKPISTLKGKVFEGVTYTESFSDFIFNTEEEARLAFEVY